MPARAVRALMASVSWQVFQVRKVQGTNAGRIFAMKVLKKVTMLPAFALLSLNSGVPPVGLLKPLFV